MAAQGYQESTLDQNVKSPVGAIGVMQVMPPTGKELNVGNISEVEPNIHAGVKYMRFMMDQYFKDEPMDDLNKMLMTFAAYNAGPGRLRQLRRETEKRGLDPNLWFNNVERVASERIGRETVTYVSNIYKYYITYRLVTDQRSRREAAKAEIGKAQVRTEAMRYVLPATFVALLFTTACGQAPQTPHPRRRPQRHRHPRRPLPAMDRRRAGFNNKIPDKVMTPDTVQSRIGTLKLVDGVPTVETTKALYDHLDFMRGVEVFLNFIPATSMEALRRGNVDRGATKSNQAVIFDQLMDSNPLFLTGNTDTVYCMGFLDLEADGPTVIEVPPGTGPGTVDDAFFRFVTDMGGPGPDRGQGGKYLIVPEWFKGAIPKDKKDGGEYFVARSPSKVNWVVLRGFLKDGKPDAASKMFREGVKIYALSKAAAPPTMEFINGSKVAYNTVHANNFEFYEELDAVIQREPLELVDPELRGLAGSIGIVKGKPFAPDDRMKKTLTDAVGGRQCHRASDLVPQPRSARLPLRQEPMDDVLHRRRFPLARWRWNGRP